MEAFSALGKRIRDKWHAKDYDVACFADLATEVLSAHPPSSNVSAEDVLFWVATEDPLPLQKDVKAAFGQPPITVYSCPEFYIDVLVWTTSSTAIHQHAFEGCFHVLDGSSIQGTFDFRPSWNVSSQLRFGELKLQAAERLSKGDVRPIHAGNALIHSLFHLDNPSVSVVVRTSRNQNAGIQYSYLRPGIAFDPFDEPDALLKRWQVFRHLAECDPARAKPWIDATLGRCTRYECFQWIAHHMQFLEDEKLGSTVKHLISTAKTRFGNGSEVLDAMVQRYNLERDLVDLRATVTDSDHRFLLALLANFTERGSVYDLMARYYSPTPPATLTASWLAQLSRNEDVARHIGYVLEDDSLRIATALLRGQSLERIIEDLKQAHGTAVVDRQLDEVAALVNSLRSAGPFATLFCEAS